MNAAHSKVFVKIIVIQEQIRQSVLVHPLFENNFYSKSGWCLTKSGVKPKRRTKNGLRKADND